MISKTVPAANGFPFYRQEIASLGTHWITYIHVSNEQIQEQWVIFGTKELGARKGQMTNPPDKLNWTKTSELKKSKGENIERAVIFNVQEIGQEGIIPLGND